MLGGHSFALDQALDLSREELHFVVDEKYQFTVQLVNFVLADIMHCLKSPPIQGIFGALVPCAFYFLPHPSAPTSSAVGATCSNTDMEKRLLS